MSFLIELRTSTIPSTYVLAHAPTEEVARAQVDAQLGHCEDLEDFVIVAVHPVH